MYLSELKLWNFRKYGSKDLFDIEKPNLIVPFNKGLNVLIGENDSGKTAIIDAIKLVLKTHAYEWIKVEESDFYKNTDKLRIELEFKDIKPNEAKNFIEWLGWEGIGDDAKPILRLNYQVEIKQDRIIATDVKAGMDETGYPLNAEAREYLKTTYLKALRDADNDLTAKKNSRLSQILQEHEFFKKKTKTDKHPFEIEFKDLNDKIEIWFKNDGNEKLKKVIDTFLISFTDENKKANISLGNNDIKNILEKISLGILDQKNLGLGTMNRLYMATELLHLKKDNWNGLRLCMIEELEAHLHPQAQMKIIEALQKEKEVQFILSTHSPNLASKVKLHNLILCNNDSAFPLGEEPNDANKKSKSDKYTKLSKDDYTFLERFLDVTKANLFFAKGVILVEGWSEEILLPVLAKRLGYDLTKKEVSIINVGSTAYLRFAKIFLRNDDKELSIPVAVISDIDLPEFEREIDTDQNGKPKKEGKNNVYKLNRLIVKDETRISTKKKKEGEFDNSKSVLHFVSNLWTFEYCLLKSNCLSNEFKEILQEIHSDTFSNEDWEENLAKILLSKSIKKTEIAYKLSLNEDKIEINTIDKNDTLYYIINAIKHACNES
jgi:putative ATP-dependent endonuclease of the OLD family